jgi:putative ABC transport system permease protein
MHWYAALQLALRALWRNKTRAMLTTLGVIIGVGSVIAMVAIGEGASQRIASQIEKMGTNNLVLLPGSITRGGVRAGAGTRTSLTMSDVDALRDLPGVVAVSPSVRAGVQAIYRGANWGTAIQGVTPNVLQVSNWDIAAGRFFTQRDVASANNTCVLGQTVAQELFGLADPIGQVIVMKGLACRVIGLLGRKGASAWGSDQDDIIFAPITTVQRKIMGITYINRAEVETTGRAAASRVEKEVKRLLRKRHRLAKGDNDDFHIYNRATLFKTAEETARVFTWLLGSIASVSLLVGGIGIMNIMLVSVTERTREIGVRRAIGARSGDILRQFLIEGVVLTLAGGLVGIALGVGVSTALTRSFGWSVGVGFDAIALALLFCLAIGVFFGAYPARKAARLDPITALRSE